MCNAKDCLAMLKLNESTGLLIFRMWHISVRQSLTAMHLAIAGLQKLNRWTPTVLARLMRRPAEAALQGAAGRLLRRSAVEAGGVIAGAVADIALGGRPRVEAVLMRLHAHRITPCAAAQVAC